MGDHPRLKQGPDYLARRGQQVDYFGIIVSGEAEVAFENPKIDNIKLGKGDTIGHMLASEWISGPVVHKYNIKATTHGTMIVIPLAEIKGDLRKFPEAVSIYRFNFII